MKGQLLKIQTMYVLDEGYSAWIARVKVGQDLPEKNDAERSLI